MTYEEQVAHYAAVRKRLAYAGIQHTKAQPEPEQTVVEVKPTPEPEDILSPTASFPMTPPKWARLVGQHICQARGLHYKLMMEKTRRTAYTRARWEVMLHAHNAGWSTTRTARIFGMDHTTAIHGVKTIKKLIAEGKYELCVLPAHIATAPASRDPITRSRDN